MPASRSLRQDRLRRLLRDAGTFDKFAGLKDRPVEERVQHRYGVLRMREFRYPPLHLIVKRKHCPHPRGVGVGLLHDGIEEELDPAVPVAVLADATEAGVRSVAVGFQILAHIEHRARQRPLLEKEQRDQQPTDTAIAVLEWVEQLELGMDDGGLN